MHVINSIQITLAPIFIIGLLRVLKLKQVLIAFILGFKERVEIVLCSHTTILNFNIECFDPVEVDRGRRSGYMKHTLLKEVFFYSEFA